jgi:hypothetical protein
MRKRKSDCRLRQLKEAALNLGMSEPNADHYAAEAAERENAAIADAQHGFDNMALGYYVPSR